jgi:Fuc2NAc and GlcNAc transferase
VRQHAIRHAILDIPNDRSSHTVATPRGGGLAIAIVSLTGIVLGAGVGLLPVRLAIGLTGGGALVATIGWLDDRRSLDPLTRLVAQTAAALWLVFWVGGMPTFHFGSAAHHLGGWGAMIAVLAVVWCTNLFNFMDGIDALAGSEAVSVGVIAGLLLLSNGSTALACVTLLIAAASAGFLVWNLPPARIFMGDVGSSLLGFLFSSLAVVSEGSALPIVWWAILFLVFVLDATITLFRRAARREAVYSAHREHAYQRAVSSGWSHGRVTSAVVVMNLVLGALAKIGWDRPTYAWPIVAGAVAASVIVYVVVERRVPMRAVPSSS